MSAITGRAVTAGGGGIANRLDFTYTGGTFNERTADGVVEFLETGILTMKKDTYVDVFMVGGGAGGTSAGVGNGGAGGGSGYTKTIINALLRRGVEYQVTIGAGGTAGVNGGDTAAFGYSVDGGHSAANAGTGGSGAGAAGAASSTSSLRAGRIGGSNGSDGAAGQFPGGVGQGSTTREFGEATGKLYAGGGGGGGAVYTTSSIGTGGAGGIGGGGNGGNAYYAGTEGTANTGGGGGGAGGTADSSQTRAGGTGGSGIVCIRLHQDDPTENVLSGTWKFNDTLTMPSTLFTENFDYDGTFVYAGSNLYASMGMRDLGQGRYLLFGHNFNDLSANYVQIYSFTTNTWVQATAKTIKFWNRYQVVSPEFYAWFTANATKISD